MQKPSGSPALASRRVGNASTNSGKAVVPVKKNLPANRSSSIQVRPPSRVPVERAFPAGRPMTRLYGVERYREPEPVVVVKKVLDSDLKHVLIVLATLLVVAFLVGLTLWGMS